MRETEITIEVFGQKEDVKKRIESLGFKLVRHTVMTDWYFSKKTTDELKQMSYEEIMRNSFLVRKLEYDGTTKTLLHFKDKDIDENGNTISEEKLAEPLQNAENTVKIFLMAGLNNWINITQDMFIYNGNNMEFALQIVDGIGQYIEYEEDESVAGLDTYEKIDRMVKKLSSFGLKLGQDTNVKKVYKKFLMENSEEEKVEW